MSFRPRLLNESSLTSWLELCKVGRKGIFMNPNWLLDSIIELAEQETFTYYIKRIRECLGIDVDDNTLMRLAAFTGFSFLMKTIEDEGEAEALETFKLGMDAYRKTIEKTVKVKIKKTSRAAGTLLAALGKAEMKAPETNCSCEKEPEGCKGPCPSGPCPAAEAPSHPAPVPEPPSPKRTGGQILGDRLRTKEAGFGTLAEAFRKAGVATGVNRKRDEFPDCPFAVPPEDKDK